MNVTGHTALLGVIGDPVSHSLSPSLHNRWIEAAGLDAAYLPLRLKSEDPSQSIRRLGEFGFLGASVTTPHKSAAAQAADHLDPAAARLGAVNTLRWDKERGLLGHNTDAPGFISALDEAAPQWRRRVDSALVLGAGGAARAIAWGLAQEGVRAIIANRTQSKAEAAAEMVGAGVLEWEQLPGGFVAADLIVNATTLGMHGGPTVDWPIGGVRPGVIVADAVYAPLETPLLAAARARGLAVVDGLGMLVHQAALAFAEWFGISPDTVAALERLRVEAAGR